MLAYAVILLAIIYLVLRYTGLFDDIANILGGGRPSGRSSGSAGKEKQRLQVFEDFFGQSGEDEQED